MKLILFVVILGFSLNFISAFSWFNFGAEPVNTRRLTTVRQQPIASKMNRVSRTPFQRTAVNVQRQQNQLTHVRIADSKTNRTPLQRALTQRQPLFRNAFVVHRQQNSLRNAALTQRPTAIGAKASRVNRRPLHRAFFQRKKTIAGQQTRVKSVADSQRRVAVSSSNTRTPFQHALTQRQQAIGTKARRVNQKPWHRAAFQHRQLATGQQSQAKNVADSPRNPKQRQFLSRSTNHVHRQADSIRKQNHPFMKNRPANSTNYRVLKPRFRWFMKNRQNVNAASLRASRRTFIRTSSAKAALADSQLKNPLWARKGIQSQRPRAAVRNRIVRSTKAGPSQRALTTKTTGNRKAPNDQRISGNLFFPQRWRGLHHGPSPHANIRSHVHRRKRDGESYNVPPGLYGIIFSRREPLNSDDNNSN